MCFELFGDFKKGVVDQVTVLDTEREMSTDRVRDRLKETDGQRERVQNFVY